MLLWISKQEQIQIQAFLDLDNQLLNFIYFLDSVYQSLKSSLNCIVRFTVTQKAKPTGFTIDGVQVDVTLQPSKLT